MSIGRGKVARFWRNVVCVGALVSVGTSFGCASMFINGGKLVKRDLAQVSVASYRLEACTSALLSAEQLKMEGVSYHLVDLDNKNELFLFERGEDGTGTLFQNKWISDDGHHYYAWVNSMGVATSWELIMPEDRSMPGRRLVYLDVTYKKHSDGSFRPTSTPSAECKLIPQVKSAT